MFDAAILPVRWTAVPQIVLDSFWFSGLRGGPLRLKVCPSACDHQDRRGGRGRQGLGDGEEVNARCCIHSHRAPVDNASWPRFGREAQAPHGLSSRWLRQSPVWLPGVKRLTAPGGEKYLADAVAAQVNDILTTAHAAWQKRHLITLKL